MTDQPTGNDEQIDMAMPTEGTHDEGTQGTPAVEDVEQTADTEAVRAVEVEAVEVGAGQAPTSDDAAEVAGAVPAEPATEEASPAEPATEEASPAEPTTPAPRPVPRPMPRPGSRPGLPTTAVVPAAAPTVVAPADTTPPLDPAEVARAAAFGRVDADGTVSVRESAGERVVGQYPEVAEDEALSLYIRRFLDLKSQVALFGARLVQLSTKDIDSTLQTLTTALEEPAVVGDLDGLRAQLDSLRIEANERRRALTAEREAAKAKGLAERTTIVERAEQIAGADPARVQWRQQGEELRTLLDQWKHAQKTGVRLDRGSEDSLWKRFSHARSQFDRNRRQHFAELDKQHGDVKATKERLIERAEQLATSTDWGATAAAYRDLMEEWKNAGRASRKDDDALWARFRGAQDAFFEARNALNAQTDAEFSENLKVKLEILAQAEALVPVRDLRAAKAALRGIQDRWEAAGKVPRADVQRVEGRLRAVEQAVRDGEQHEWKRSNPQVRARAEGAAAQLEAAISGLEDDLATAKASGDTDRIKQATEALQARQAWLAQVLRAADDAR